MAKESFLNLNIFEKKFFNEWKDDRLVFDVCGVSITGFLILFLLWLLVNAPELGDIANIYLWLLIVAVVVAFIDYNFEKTKFIGFEYFGDSFKRAGIAFVGGLILAFVLVSSLQFILPIPFAVLPQATIFGVNSAAIFVVIVAVYCEEKHFRWFWFPTLKHWLQNVDLALPFVKYSEWWAGLIAAVVVSLVFAFFHWGVLGGNIGFSFVFSMIAITINHIFRSGAAGLGLHFGNNYLAAIAMGLI